MTNAEDNKDDKKIKEEHDQFVEKDKDVEKTFKVQKHQIKELEQEKLLADEIIEKTEKKFRKVNAKIKILIVAVAVAVFFSGYSFYEHEILSNSIDLKDYKSSYIVQDNQGQPVNTWVPWNLAPTQALDVGIVNDANLPDDKVNAVKDAILSGEEVTVNNSLLNGGVQGTSTLYKGWQGALAQASLQATKYYIPQNFDISTVNNGGGQIIITLTNDQNPDGLSGTTKSTAYENQIIKSKITIYQASRFSAPQLSAVIRHEFGHALGLGHSSDPNDLMHSTIQTQYPYISICDLDTVRALYNLQNPNDIACQGGSGQ